MSEARGNRSKILVITALLTAIVVVLQYLGQFIRFGTFSISLVLIPIVIGAAIGGPKVSTWLGLVFGGIVLATDAGAFLAINVVGTVVTVIVKGIACGAVAGFAYKLIEKKNKYVAVVVAAILCPLVNTGVFLLGCVAFFLDTIREWGTAFGFGSTLEYVFLGLVGGNFLFEVATNAILSPIVVKLLSILKVR